MDVLFRADANRSIGMGHIMRCLSMADAFCAMGHKPFFVLADDGVLQLIKDRGYEAAVLDCDYREMEKELKLWPSATPELVVVDSYYVTGDYLSTLRERVGKTGGKLVYLDDVYAFPYPVDILVDYNAYAQPAIYRKLYEGGELPIPELVLGPSYAPLRSMFRGVPKKEQSREVKEILVSTGGSDEMHLTLSLLRALIVGEQRDCRYHFLVGAMNGDKAEICHLADGRENIIIHENVKDMRSLISGCDLAISAAGSTLYEICACGVPLVTYALADNQLPGAEAFGRLGLAMNAGDLRDPDTIDPTLVMSGGLKEDSSRRVLEEAERLSDDYGVRVIMAAKMQKLIDGFGADRMVQKLLEQVLQKK